MDSKATQSIAIRLVSLYDDVFVYYMASIASSGVALEAPFPLAPVLFKISHQLATKSLESVEEMRSIWPSGSLAYSAFENMVLWQFKSIFFTERQKFNSPADIADNLSDYLRIISMEESEIRRERERFREEAMVSFKRLLPKKFESYERIETKKELQNRLEQIFKKHGIPKKIWLPKIF